MVLFFKIIFPVLNLHQLINKLCRRETDMEPLPLYQDERKYCFKLSAAVYQRADHKTGVFSERAAEAERRGIF